MSAQIGVVNMDKIFAEKTAAKARQYKRKVLANPVKSLVINPMVAETKDIGPATLQRFHEG